MENSIILLNNYKILEDALLFLMIEKFSFEQITN